MTRLMPLTLLIAVLAAPLAAATDAPATGSGEFKLMSSELVAGGRLELRHVFNGFGCTGGNVSPALSWSGAPAGTKSFAVTVYDPDAPTGSGWWHWVLFNLPAASGSLAEGAGNPDHPTLPAGAIQSRGDSGQPGYSGACPPPGPAHRYIFTLYALDVAALPLTPDASGALVGGMIHRHKIARAAMILHYARPQ